MALQIPPNAKSDLALALTQITRINSSLNMDRGRNWTDEQRQLLTNLQLAITNLFSVLDDLIAVNDTPPRSPSTRRVTSAPV